MPLQPVSLPELKQRAGAGLAHHRDRVRPPETALEWLGIAVGQLPELTARARTADEIHWRSRTQSVQLRGSLLEALLDALGAAAAIVEEARARLVERYPESAAADDAEGYADVLATAHRSAPRRAEMMIGGYASFLGGAIEAAGALAESELTAARARRWDPADHAGLAAVRATQLHAALTNALGGLLAYACLVAADAARLRD